MRECGSAGCRGKPRSYQESRAERKNGPGRGMLFVDAAGAGSGEIPHLGRRRRVRQPGRVPVQLRPHVQAFAGRQRRGGAGAGAERGRGGHRHRPADAQDDRPRSAEGGERDPPRRGGDHRDRLHRRRRADRVDQPGAHLPLRHQAVGLERAARRPHPRRRALRAPAREPPPRGAALRLRRDAVEGGAQRVQLRRHRGRFPLAARCAGAGRAGGPDARRRCSCAGRRAPARRWWRARSTSTARARRGRS